MTNSGEITAIIIDDEFPARENLKFLIDDHCPEIKVIGTADGVESGLALFNDKKPDLIFLDIRMPSGAEGFDLVDQLEGRDFHVVFVTAFKEYAIKAFEKRALHYLLKPIDENDLKETVKRIVEKKRNDETNATDFSDYKASLKKLEEEIARQASPKRISVHHSKGIKIISPEDLTHLEGSGNCSLLHFTNKEEYLDTRTLKVYETILPANFHRVHKSFIVNLHEVAEILHGDNQAIILRNGKSIPVSRERKKELIDRLREMD